MSQPVGAVNAWKCNKCGRLTVARHADAGVTPMFLACRASGDVMDCGGQAVSSGYPSEPVPDRILDRLEWEWYRPDSAELRTFGLDMQDHIRRGGLALRRINEVTT